MASDESAQPELTAQWGKALLDAFDQIEDVGVFVKDAERRFVACSEPIAQSLGYRHSWQLFGLRDEDISPEYLVEHYRGHDEHVLSTGDALIDLVELVRNPNGSYDWFLTTKTPVRPHAGAPIGIVGVTRALTKRDSVSRRLLSLTPAVELISREYTRALSIEELATTVSLSPSHFSRSFKAHFGATPHQYLRRVRLMAACDLLATSDLPMSVIANQTGFYDQSHLSNEFKKERGITPAEYRAAHGNTSQARRSRVPFNP
ncbi:helix-turn-helix domain-containing protein [Streptomyces iranensis]|uniref:AraC-like DNA-binding protein n=1 Tax=Streptomyces iranensis TaxID=576784 RepID=A0ABS4NAP3_9ACTN|nr:AraC family transcriptional regulator [Streptomyces iranensis]MBP2068491.1 AraC-like DNA-binding protein [Streptomyces iranensis]